VIPQGFHPALSPGRLTAVDVATGVEYVIHQSSQAAGGFTFPLAPDNSPRFYHRAVFHDMNGDGLEDIVTVRSGFRVVPSVYPPFSELVYFTNPGTALSASTPWQEHVLFGGPAAGFLGPDIHLAMHDFESDGVPEIVATHFFSGASPQNGKIVLYGAPAGGSWSEVDALHARLPRVAVLSSDQGIPFDIQVSDLNFDGRADILATNHQPDGCSAQNAMSVPGRVYALEAPSSGDVFTQPWATHILLDNIRPNPTLPGGSPRAAPGRAQVFWPLRGLDGLTRPWIVVGGDEAGKVWMLRPQSGGDVRDQWSYQSSVVFDINATYGAGTTQTPRPPGITLSTVGSLAVRYDRPGPFGVAEFYVPVFEAQEIHILGFRPGRRGERRTCAQSRGPLCTP
jgi:hypothetical protein